MNRFLLLLLIPFFIYSCKNKEAKVYDLVSSYNENKEAINSKVLKHTKAYSLDKQNVSLDFVFDTKEENLKEPYPTELLGIISQVDEKYPVCKDLMKEGMSFKIRVYNTFGIKIGEFPLEKDTNGDLKIKIQ